MRISYQTKPVAMLLMIASLCLGSAGAFAADTAAAKSPPSPPPHAQPAPPTKEMREKMAVVHEKAAACLRSDKPMNDCHEEMMKNCHDAGAHACGMMEKHRKMMMHDDAEHDHDHESQPGTMPAKP